MSMNPVSTPVNKQVVGPQKSGLTNSVNQRRETAFPKGPTTYSNHTKILNIPSTNVYA